MNNHSEESHPPRLDPFVFPTETTLRFALLIVAVISASLYIYNLIYWRYRSTQLDFVPLPNLAELCRSKAEVAAQSVDSVDSFLRCLEPYTKETINAAWFSIGAVGILITLASLIYSLFPVLMIRKEGLIPLEKQADMEDIVVYLRDLCQEIGIRPPIFVQKTIDRSIGGRAFGSLGRYYVVLSTGLLVLFDKDLGKFRAVMLHELSHLRNRDIDKIYFSVAISFAFMIIAVIPFALLLSGFDAFFGQMLRFTMLMLIVYLTFTSVVRSREFYADVRASTYSGSGALGLLFQAAPTSQVSALQSTIISILERLPYFKRNRWQFAFQFHPDASERRRVLEVTDRLFHLDLWVAFTTGITLIIAYYPISILINTLANYLPKYNGVLTPVFLIKGFIFASLVIGILGVGIWRSTFVTLIRHQDSAEVGKLGIALGVGMLMGKFFSLSNSSWGHNLTIVTLFTNALLLASLYYFFRWIAIGALSWLQVSIYAQSPRRFYTVGLIVVGFFLTLLFGAIFGIWDTVGSTSNSSKALFSYILLLPAGSMHFALSPLTLIASVSLWVFPVSACLCQKHQSDSTYSPKWGFLDRMPDLLYPLPQKRLEIFSVLKMGLISGFIFCGLLLALRLGIRIALPESIRGSEDFLWIFSIGQIGLTALVQSGTAMKVARTVESFRKVQGLFAAFIAGCVMSVSVLVLNLFFGGTITPQFAWIIFSQIVNYGAMLSLLAMMMVCLPKNRANVVAHRI